VTAAGWPERLQRIAVLLLSAGAFAFVLSLWLLHGRAFNTFEPAGIERLSEGGATRPYSARVLVPWAVRAAVGPWPVETRSAWVDREISESPELERWLAYFQVSRRHVFELLAAVLLDALALAGFLWAVHRLVAAFFRTTFWVAALAPAVAVLFLPLFFGRGTHFVYDLPALCFAAWALLALRLGRTGLFTVVLALGTLNKETMALALLVYLLPSFRRALGPRWRRQLAVQALAVAAARGLAVALSSPAAGEAVTNTWVRAYFVENLVAFVRDPFLLSYTKTAALLFFCLLIFADLRRKPLLLREATPVALPFLALYVWGSQWGEIRVLYELYPLFFLMGYQSCVEWIGFPIESRDAGAAEPEAASEAPRIAPALASALAGLFLAGCAVALPFLVMANLPR